MISGIYYKTFSIVKNKMYRNRKKKKDNHTEVTMPAKKIRVLAHERQR